MQTAAACFPTLAGQAPRLLPMQPGSDAAIAEQFAGEWARLHAAAVPASVFPLPSIPSLPDGLDALLSIIAGCDMMVGMRLHALILAAAAGVPSVALAYDPKVAAFMQASGQGDAVYDLSTPDADALAALIGRIWSERDERASALQAALPGLQAKARRNCDAALALL